MPKHAINERKQTRDDKSKISLGQQSNLDKHVFAKNYYLNMHGKYAGESVVSHITW